MKDEETARQIAEIAGVLVTAIAALAATTAKETAPDPWVFMNSLIETCSQLGAGQESPIQRLLFQKLAEALDQAGGAVD